MPGRIPKLCRHKATGRGYVTDPFTKKEHYFTAPYGSPECQREYDAWVGQLMARRAAVASGTPPGSSVSVARLILDYMAHARIYYRKDGKVTTEVSALEQALTHVNELYGTIQADAFGPVELKAVREGMILAGWSRRNINKQVQRIRRVWRWGVEHELVKASTLIALEAVQGLSRGRTPAPEKDPIGPVDMALVEATLPRLESPVRLMVQIQLWADMRPGEVVIMRPCDIQRDQDPWLYTPHTHKTKHRGRERRIYLGPRARALLDPLLAKTADAAWLFPSRARGRYAAGRKHWTVSGYRRAIAVACRQAGLEAWHPNQLRHTQATVIRETHGIEGAQAALGHAELRTTEIYAEKSDALARKIAEDLG